MTDVAPATPDQAAVPTLFWGMSENTYSMLLYLSAFVPFVGMIGPIVMWAANKDGSTVIDAHGKNMLNWIISSIIYAVAGVILMFIYIGFVVLLALMICSLIFIIMAAVKANSGIVWRIPLAIRFLK